jgi:uncharacterized protein with PQ loop repeat
MDAPSILGLIGTLVGLVRAVPQLIRLLRSKKARGVSVDTAGISSVVSFGWATYGFLTNQPYVSLATGSSGLFFALIALVSLRFGRSIGEIKITPIWFTVLLFSGLLWGSTGLGIVLSISVLASNIPQLLVAYKEGNLSDLSLSTWLLSVTDGLVWGIYALLQYDTSIMAYGFFQLLTSGLIVARILYQRTKKLSPADTSKTI